MKLMTLIQELQTLLKSHGNIDVEVPRDKLWCPTNMPDYEGSYEDLNYERTDSIEKIVVQCHRWDGSKMTVKIV